MPGLFAYTERHTNKILANYDLNIDEFWEWMYGQTQPILPSGNLGVYPYDLHRFIGWKRGGNAPLWD